MTTETKTYYTLQRRLLSDGPDGPWVRVDSADTTCSPESAYETEEYYRKLYDKNKPGRYEWRTLHVVMTVTENPVIWSK